MASRSSSDSLRGSSGPAAGRAERTGSLGRMNSVGGMADVAASAGGGAQDASLRVAMIGLRGIPATYGGVERAVEELSAALADRGHRVTVFARRAYADETVRSHRG